MGLVFPLERYGNLPGTCIVASDLEGAEDQLNDLYPGEDRTPEKAAVCPVQGHRIPHPLFFAHIKGLQWPSRKHTVRRVTSRMVLLEKAPGGAGCGYPPGELEIAGWDQMSSFLSPCPWNSGQVTSDT